MHDVKVSAVLSNGTLYARVGTACVAIVAHAFRVPLLVCCEAYKFLERLQLDSICSNQLGTFVSIDWLVVGITCLLNGMFLLPFFSRRRLVIVMY